GRDFVDGEQVGAKAPGPHSLAAIFMSCFINIQAILLRQQGQQLFERVFEAVADFPNQFGHLSAADADADYVAEVILDPPDGHMAWALETTDQCRQMLTDPSCLPQVFRPRHANLFFARRAPLHNSLMFRDVDRALLNFDLLNDLRGRVQVLERTSAT